MFKEIMLSYCLGRVNGCHCEFKPVLSYSKHNTFSTLIAEEKENEMHLFSLYIKSITLKYLLCHYFYFQGILKNTRQSIIMANEEHAFLLLQVIKSDRLI